MARKVTIPGQNVPIQICNAVNPDWYLVLRYLETLQPLSDINFPHDDTKSDVIRTTDIKTANYKLGLTDAKKVLAVYTGGGAVTVALPARGAVAWSVGTQIDLVTWGGLNLPISFPTNVLVISKTSYTKIAADEGGMLLYYGDGGTNQYWFLRGSLVA